MNHPHLMRATVVATAIMATAVMTFVGCTPANIDKSGGSGSPTTLVLANNNGDGLVGALGVARFVDNVTRLSGGRVSVQVDSTWRGGENEGRVITDVAAGLADLGWSGTRAFDTVGVPEFRPLHAPFLINSYAAEDAVVQSPMAGDLLASLKPMGLDGLALLSDQLRMPTAASGPLLTPADFRGKVIRTFASNIQSDALLALGAQPTFERGGLEGAETSWSTYQAQSQYGSLPYITYNAVLWPRSVALFANSKKLASLDAETRGWIAEAATEASVWSTNHAGDETVGQIAQVCKLGARIVTATPQQLSKLRATVEPVYAELRTDPAQAKTLAQIEAVVAATAPSPLPTVPAGCRYRRGEEKHVPAPAKKLTEPGKTGDLPQGTYRYELTHDGLVAAGLSEYDANLNAGIVTWVVRAGRWSYEEEAADGHTWATRCEGFYSVDGDAVAFTTLTHIEGGDCAPPVWSARYTASENSLRWSGVTIPDFIPVWSTPTWERIQ
jgi:TRAP-type C4-dicarboxylate transport system substrate-binding protein